MAPALRFPSKLEMLSCSARAAGFVGSDGGLRGDGVFDDGTRKDASSSSVSLPSVGAFLEDSNNSLKLGCAESGADRKRVVLDGLDAGGSVGEELGTTSSWSASSAGRPKDDSSLAASAPGWVASCGGVSAGGACEAVLSSARSGDFVAERKICQHNV